MQWKSWLASHHFSCHHHSPHWTIPHWMIPHWMILHWMIPHWMILFCRKLKRNVTIWGIESFAFTKLDPASIPTWESVLVLTLGSDRLFLYLISVNGMGVMWQAWSEDKQTVFHEGFCRSTNWSWTIFQALLATKGGNEAVEHFP